MKTLLLIDGNSLVNRAYYGVKSSTNLTSANGTPTHAVFGFYNTLSKYLEDIRPELVAVAFDTKAPTFRHTIYDGYKGDRKGMPEELAVQMPLLKELIDAMRVCRIEQEGLEADDFIGIISRIAEEADTKVVIVTGDRDALQLVSDRVTVMLPSTGKSGTETRIYTPSLVMETYGVSPAALIEVKALMGDASDSIPGVPSVGEKTALSLVSRYGSLEAIYENLEDITRPALKKNLTENRDMAFLSRVLGTIKRDTEGLTDAPIPGLQQLSWAGVDRAMLKKVFERLEFRSLIRKLKLNLEEEQVADKGVISVQEPGKPEDDGEAEIKPLLMSEEEKLNQADSEPTKLKEFSPAMVSTKAELEAFESLFRSSEGPYALLLADPFGSSTSVLWDVEARAACEANSGTKETSDTQETKETEETKETKETKGTKETKEAKAEKEAKEAKGAKKSKDSQDEFMQMSFSNTETANSRLALGVSAGNASWIIITGNGITKKELAAALSRAIDKGIIYCHDIKSLARFFLEQDAAVPSGMFDTMLAEYLIDSSRDRYFLTNIAAKHLGEAEDTPDRLIFEAARQAVPIQKYLKSIDYSLGILPLLGNTQREILEANGQLDLYNEIEAPLALVLAEMELQGFRIDADTLLQFSETLRLRLVDLESNIYSLAGESFNILSPKQLGSILFEKLKLQSSKKTKTGFSTDVEVLEALAADHPIVPELLSYRQISKLKSTYADGLVKEISSATGRVHTRFNQTIAVTGRISSTEPNLQNIPIRTELGRSIRKAFIPKNGCLFVDADYSQIELRVLAHITGDETLSRAYYEGIDIHSLTASQVFKIPLSEVSGEMRRRAKAVNFGIIYGISDYGLSRDLGIFRKEAAEYIKGYLDTYTGVRSYMEAIVEQAKRDGYVETLMHRRRYLPELQSSNFNVRSFGKRIALNTPIQGSAADIIKIAMIKVRNALKENFPEAKLILQVHDELVVEAPERLVAEVGSLVKECMEKAVTLSVPLVADVSYGASWYDAKE